VYEFDPAVHLIYAADCPHFTRRYRSVDFGYQNPFVCQFWGEDYDGRLYLYKEIYMPGRTINQHAPQIKQLSQGYTFTATIADHDAEDRATLAEHGIETTAADKRLSVGIEKVTERLKVQPDGKPRLFLVRDCTHEAAIWPADQHRRPVSTEAEFAGYVWPETKAARAADEKPVKADDHGMDALRYMVMYLDGGISSTVGATRYVR
jgi:phage terminase large subunit